MILAGIFVGGASRRMGRPKGLLAAPSGESSIIARWAGIFDRQGVPHVLVGKRDEYAHCGNALDDDPPEIGPIGGLHALALHASRLARVDSVIAVACDMPLVTDTMVQRLALAPHDPSHPIVAPRRDGRWEPLMARYDVAPMLDLLPLRIAQRAHRLQDLLDSSATELVLSADELGLLHDWDEPGDV